MPPPAVQVTPAYGAPTCPAGGTPQLSVSAAGATTKFVTGCVCVTEALSVTFKVKEKLPVAVGVPVIAPVVGFTLNHPGAPAAEYVYGEIPPEAVQLPEYPTPTCAESGALHVSNNGAGATTKFVTACV